MKKRSDWVMAAMLARSVALGPCGTETRSVPSSPSQRPCVYGTYTLLPRSRYELELRTDVKTEERKSVKGYCMKEL